MQHIHILDTYTLNKYEIMHEDDHNLNLTSLHLLRLELLTF